MTAGGGQGTTRGRAGCARLQRRLDAARGGTADSRDCTKSAPGARFRLWRGAVWLAVWLPDEGEGKLCVLARPAISQ